MKTLMRLALGLVLVLTVLGTLAVAGLLSWVGDQESIRVIVDGQQVQLRAPQGWAWVGVMAGVAAVLVALLTVVPVLVVVALVLGLIGTVLGGVLALLPVVLVVGLIWWLVQRPRGIR